MERKLKRKETFNGIEWTVIERKKNNTSTEANYNIASAVLSLSTRSPAVARGVRPYWPSRKTVIPSGIGLAAVLGVGHLSCLVKLIVH